MMHTVLEPSYFADPPPSIDAAMVIVIDATVATAVGGYIAAMLDAQTQPATVNEVDELVELLIHGAPFRNRADGGGE